MHVPPKNIIDSVPPYTPQWPMPGWARINILNE